MIYIIVHHLPMQKQDAPNVEGIRRYHKSVKKWPDIWYHNIVASQATYLTASWEPMHDRGNGNWSIDIALSGDFRTATPTKYQLQVLTNFINNYKHDKVIGHSEARRLGLRASASSCPGDNLLKEVKKINMSKLKEEEINLMYALWMLKQDGKASKHWSQGDLSPLLKARTQDKILELREQIQLFQDLLKKL